MSNPAGEIASNAQPRATPFMAASSALTRQQLDWNPTGPDLLTDLRKMDYTAA